MEIMDSNGRSTMIVNYHEGQVRKILSNEI